MSLSAGRHLVSRLFNTHSNKYVKCVSVRFKVNLAKEKSSSADESLKPVIPIPEPGKIQKAVLKKFSQPLSIENADPPKGLTSNEVLIDINYCALNGPDVLLCENAYIHEPVLPFVPGYEITGKLLEVGEEAKKAGYNIGDRVIALNKEKYGGLADQCIAEIGDVWKIPSTIRSVDAVCLLENNMTALIALEKFGAIDENDMVLVNVGLGGIGLSAVDIASHIFRAKVIGVSFTEERADIVRERGAFAAFTFSDKKLIKAIEKLAIERDIKDVFSDASGHHFKKVLDTFMKVYKTDVPSKTLLRDDNFGVVVQHLGPNARIMIAGVAAMQTELEESDPSAFTVNGICLRDHRKRKHELYRQSGEDILTFFEDGFIKPSPSMIAGLYNINDAVKFISDMKACGKVVIDIKNKEAKAKVMT